MGNGIGQKGLYTVRQENDKFCKKYIMEVILELKNTHDKEIKC